MSEFTPEIGTLLLHVPNNSPPRDLIYTKMGYLPNDVKAMKRTWNEGLHCGNGLNECMTRKEFSKFWANTIENNYRKHISKKSHTTTC